MAGPAKSAAAVGSHVPLLLQMSIAEGRNVASQTASAVFVTLTYEEGRRRRKGRRGRRGGGRGERSVSYFAMYIKHMIRFCLSLSCCREEEHNYD